MSKSTVQPAHTLFTPKRIHMLREIQRQSFGYFLHETNPANGLVTDKTAPSWPSSIAAVGMALTAYPIGVERGWMTRAHALDRSLRTLRFFAESEQSESPTATGYRGFYYHFLDRETGKRAADCELSSIDTALLIVGVLAAACYFDGSADAERELRRLADLLYARIDWAWMCDGDRLLRHGWMPGSGFLPYRWRGYDESMIMYLLAFGAPDHPLPGTTWDDWLLPGAWRAVEGIEYLHAGPLFIHQYAHIWLELRDLQDAFMRAHHSDYFENSRRAVLVQQRYAERNPGGFALGEGVTEIVLSSSGQARAVRTAAGRLFPADLVILGLGVRPNVQLAEAAGISLGPSGAITVDRRMHTQTEHVWAAGDCVESRHVLTHRPVNVALGTHANKQGRVAGDNIGGAYAAFHGVLGTAVTKVAHTEVARTGLSTHEAVVAGFRVVATSVDSTVPAPG